MHALGSAVITIPIPHCGIEMTMNAAAGVLGGEMESSVGGAHDLHRVAQGVRPGDVDRSVPRDGESRVVQVVARRLTLTGRDHVRPWSSEWLSTIE